MTRKEWWLMQIEGYSLTDEIRFEPKWGGANIDDVPKTMYEFEQWIKAQGDNPEIFCEYWNHWKKFTIEPDGSDKWLIDLY